MARTVSKEIYKFAELSEEAKEKARDWYRTGGLDYEWWDFVFEDAKTVGALLGIEIDNVYFSGFASQGDGAQFVGSYAYKRGALAAVKAYAPSDATLAGIAANLQDLQRRNFYALSASVSSRRHYSHEYCTDIAVYDERDHAYNGMASDDAADGIAEFLRDFMHWIYKQLENEWEYLNSDESVDEAITANEYEFTADGELYF